MASVSALLSVLIPLGIIIFIGMKIYAKMSEDNPNWFASFKAWISEKNESRSTKMDPMHEGSIRYAPG